MSALKENSLLEEARVMRDKATYTMLSKDEEIKDYCMTLATQVDAHTETIIQEMREWNERTREKIKEYQEECLKSYDMSGRLEASATVMKSLLDEMESIIQNRSSQQLDEQTEQNELIKKLSAKLVDLQLHYLVMRNQKFSGNIIELEIKNAEFKPDEVASLESANIFSSERLIRIRTIQDMMPEFKELVYCFINPYATPHQLIALVLNKSEQVVFVKMRLNGEILMQKPAPERLYVLELCTLPSGFMIQTYKVYLNERKLKRFDYDFNELTIDDDFGSGDGVFSANQSHFINIKSNKSYGRWEPPQLCLRSHDLSRLCTSVCYDGGDCFKMLATDKYLYTWWDHDEDHYLVMTTFAIETKCGIKCEQHVECFDPLPKSVYANQFPLEEIEHSDCKVVGDKYIAMHCRGNRISLLSHNSQLSLLKEFEIGINDCPNAIKMSTDSSNGFCFFDSKSGAIFLFDNVQ